MAVVDLSGISVVDNHCHPILGDAFMPSVADWRSRFSEAADANTRAQLVPFTVFYRRLIRAMARFHGCEPDEDAVLAARESCERSLLLHRLGREANVHTLII